MNEEIRLSKLMSERKICSRREADRFIEQGMVIVDGEVISTLGTKVSPHALVELLPEAQREQRAKVTILLNKPVGYVSTQPEKGYRPAIDLIVPDNQVRERGDPILEPAHLWKLSVVGRLDIDSKGMLLLTQDGSVAKAVIGPDADMEKEYLVRVSEDVPQDAIRKLRSGLSLDGKVLKRAKVDLLHPSLLRIVLREGKKRQIRRMCELVNLRAISLKRVRIGKIYLGDLPIGKWRFLQCSLTNR
ncbi:MAG: 23S rRNA pseudouridine(2604) synthase [Chlamydiae bacterium]|nr:23S rRNA pseudouridine(2604) synthase [Chlamydiota bacterium]